jgi:hypothetical protein
LVLDALARSVETPGVGPGKVEAILQQLVDAGAILRRRRPSKSTP